MIRKRTERHEIKWTPEEYQWIKEHAEDEGLDVSSFIRSKVLHVSKYQKREK